MADAGQAMGAAGSLISGMAGFQAGKGNARLRRAEAKGALNEGVAQEADIRAQARRSAGEALAAMGANGGGLGEGSALDVLREGALESELDRLRVRRGAANKAASLNFQAKMAKRQGAFDMMAGVMNAGKALIGGGG